MNMDLNIVERLGRELHTTHTTGVMGEEEVCPWTLFLAMSLTLLKGIQRTALSLVAFLIAARKSKLYFREDRITPLAAHVVRATKDPR